MYIFECIWKLFNRKNKDTDEFSYNPLNTEIQDTEYERCLHKFMPVDSTGETLACIKCGFIVQRSNIKEVTDNDSSI